METLPVTPELPLDVGYEYHTVKTEFESGGFQTRAIWPRPRRTWRLAWNVATPAEAEVLQAFGRGHSGPASPFYFVPGECVPRPYAGPVLSQTVGGALGARTRYAAFSWADASNETTVSYVVTSLSVASGYLLTATVPRFPAGVTRAWVYVGETSAVLHRQATAVTTEAGTWTEPTAGYDSGGASPPAANTLAETVTVHFVDDTLSFRKESGAHWAASATIVEVL
jgi:hypothetical protein